MTDSSKQKAPGLAGHEGFQKDSSKRSNFSAKSTATEAQICRLLEMLRLRPHTSHELSKAGIYHSPARILQLRKRGCDIETHRVALVDEWGYQHTGCALYELHGEPAGA